MNFFCLFSRPCLAFVLCSILVGPLLRAETASEGSGAAKGNPIQEGKARFTVITPNLVRIEWAPSGKFVDNPSFFAVNRGVRTDAFTVRHEGSALVIETSALSLKYTPNGKPFDADNLQIAVTDAAHPWHPGVANEGNLGGTLRTLDKMEKPAPLPDGLISKSGWYLLDDSKSALLTKDWVASRPGGSGTDWYFFGYGQDFAAALRSLTAVSGRVPLPRKYALGIWSSRFWPYTTQEFEDLVKGYGENDFPLDVVVMDINWHLTHRDPKADRFSYPNIWTSYTWDKKLIPDPAGLLKWMRDQGLHVTLNDHPADGVQAGDEKFAAFMQAMGRKPTDAPLAFDAADKKYMDTFWKITHAPIDEIGNDFWWLDWQQDPNTRSIPELTNLAALNAYYFEKSRYDGKRRGLSFSRWAGWGDQRYPIHFSGDSVINWAMLAYEVPFTSAASNVGCFFWSHDIGGHMHGLGRNDENYARWVQFGSMSAALRSHSTLNAETDRRPWTYSREAADSMRRSFHLRAELMPYIYSAAWQSSSESIPFTRPMYYAYPKEAAAYGNPQEYLLGDHLLVAPIVSAGEGPKKLAAQRVWFPAGQWRNWFSGELFSGPSEVLAPATLEEFPLFVRAGAPIVMQPYTDRPATAPLKELVVRIQPGNPGEDCHSILYEDDGESEEYLSARHYGLTRLSSRLDGDVTRLTIAPTEGAYRGQLPDRAVTVELCAVQAPRSVTVNGQPAKVAYDRLTHTATVSIPAASIRKALVIEIRAPIADPGLLRREAIARRSGGLSEKTDAASCLLAAGIGLIAWQTHPWLVDAATSAKLFVPAAMLDGAQLEIVSESHATPVTVGPDHLLTADTIAKALSGDRIRTSSSAPLTLRITKQGQVVDLPIPRLQLPSVPSTNPAAKAKVTVSSFDERARPEGAVDGVADGYPNDRTREWSSRKEREGAFLRLDWPTPVRVGRVEIYDRPNEHDQVLEGELTLSDGSKWKVGKLPNDASTPTTVIFPPRDIQWLRFDVRKVSSETNNVGLSEIAVYRN